MRLTKLLLLVCVIGILLLIPSTVLASYLDGGQATISGLLGTRAYVSYDNPYVSVGDSAWSMVAAGRYGYAQTGWAKYPGDSGIHYFTEWTDDSDPSHWVSWDATYDITGTHLYGVLQMGSYWKFYVDSTTLGTVSNSTVNFSTGYWAEYYGEAQSTSDQSPGKQSNKVRFSTVQYTTGSGWTNTPIGTWVQNLSTQSLDHANYSFNNYFDIWDGRYY